MFVSRKVELEYSRDEKREVGRTMDQFERQKITRQAINGRMSLMFGSAFLMFSAITSTLMYGINFFMTALEADKGTAEYVELLQKANLQSGFLKGIGACFVAVGIWEIVSGFLILKNSNRIDKSRFALKIVISLLAAELLLQVVLFFTGLMNLGLLFTSIVLPLFLLWGVTRYIKVSKADPERKFAVDPVKKKSPQRNQAAAPKKSIRERAAMQARVENTEEKNTEEANTEAVNAEEANTAEANTAEVVVPGEESEQ